MNFTKNDLKLGYLVQLRNGKMKMVMPKECNIILTDLDGDWHSLLSYREDLLYEECLDRKMEYDIMKIFGHSIYATHVFDLTGGYRPLLWERKEKKKMTVSEIEKELGYEVEIISKN